MPIETIWHNGKQYPKFQSEGFASRFAFPFANLLCKGTGYDIGCNRLEWAFPGAIPIDPAINYAKGSMLHQFGIIMPRNIADVQLNHEAMRLPRLLDVDYIFSSHCLEHIPDWVGVLNYWATKIKHGGVLFLYLPHPNQTYWRPWNNRKHLHVLRPKDLRHYFRDSELWTKPMVSGRDLNHSFYAIAEKI